MRTSASLFTRATYRPLSMLTMMWCVVFGTNLQANEHVRHWLERMDTAVSQLDYDGHFVYLRGDMLDAMRIRHRVNEGHTREYLISLTGTEREVIRDNNSITIIQSRNGKMHISQRGTTGKLSPLSSLDPGDLGDSYHMRMGEDMRVAGRAAKVILLQPKDKFRYACRLVLDQGNALPLDVALFDADGKQVSRIMFTDLQISYPPEKTLDAVDQGTVENYSQGNVTVLEPVAVRTGAAAGEAQEVIDLESVTSWKFDKIPAGYQLKNYRLRSKTNAMDRMEHFVFFDGLATVFVYIEPLATTGLNGEARLGAVNVLGAQVSGHKLTIVGEVPAATLKMLLSGVAISAR